METLLSHSENNLSKEPLPWCKSFLLIGGISIENAFGGIIGYPKMTLIHSAYSENTGATNKMDIMLSLQEKTKPVKYELST